MGDEFVTMREAQEILGVSKFTIWRLVKEGKLTAYQSDVDRRQKLIRRDELESVKQPKPLVVGEEKKAVA